MKEKKSLAEYAAEAREEAGGWKCRRCGCRDTRVDSTWHAQAGVRRRRICRNCGQDSYRTTEVPDANGVAERG